MQRRRCSDSFERQIFARPHSPTREMLLYLRVVTKPKPIRVLVVAGARPNFVKIAPLMECLSSPRVAGEAQPLLVHTGQHYDEALSQLFFDQLGIPRPQINLEVGSGPHGKQTAEIKIGRASCRERV